MYYTVLGFDAAAAFKQDEYETEYQGFNLSLVKEKLEEAPRGKFPIAISNQLIIPIEKKDEWASHEVGLMFLSELSWLYGVAIHDVQHGGGTGPVRMLSIFAGQRGARVTVDLQYYKAMELDETQRLAVGLYKEGISTNSIFFKCLGLYKILEIQMNGNQREQWLTDFLKDKWSGFSFSGQKEYVPTDPKELQLFLYKYGRCAVAHANTEPRVDSHSLMDFRKMSICCRIIQDAVETYMNLEMGIPKLLRY